MFLKACVHVTGTLTGKLSECGYATLQLSRKLGLVKRRKEKGQELRLLQRNRRKLGTSIYWHISQMFLWGHNPIDGLLSTGGQFLLIKREVEILKASGYKAITSYSKGNWGLCMCLLIGNGGKRQE